jgi:hypothetical protein
MNLLRPITPATTGPELRPMRNASVSPPNVRRGGFAHVEGELDKSKRVVGPLARHARGDYIAIADRRRSHRGEADDIGEQNAGGFVVRGDGAPVGLERVRDFLRRWPASQWASAAHASASAPAGMRIGDNGSVAARHTASATSCACVIGPGSAKLAKRLFTRSA